MSQRSRFNKCRMIRKVGELRKRRKQKFSIHETASLTGNRQDLKKCVYSCGGGGGGGEQYDSKIHDDAHRSIETHRNWDRRNITAINILYICP